MTKEIINKAIELQNKINRYETVIRYASVNHLKFTGTMGESNMDDDKELAKLIYEHCKKKQEEFIKEYDNL